MACCTTQYCFNLEGNLKDLEATFLHRKITFEIDHHYDEFDQHFDQFDHNGQKQCFSDLCVKVQLVDIDSLVPGKGLIMIMMKMAKIRRWRR